MRRHEFLQQRRDVPVGIQRLEGNRQVVEGLRLDIAKLEKLVSRVKRQAY